MKILLLLAAAVLLTSNIWGCDSSGVSLRIVSHQQVQSTGDADSLRMREVSWKITNNTACFIYVKGYELSRFYPINIVLSYYPTKRKWESPYGGSKIPTFARLGFEDLDDLKIKPGESKTFTTRNGDAAKSVKFKMAVYVAMGNSASSPKAVVSPVFFFNSRLD